MKDVVTALPPTRRVVDRYVPGADEGSAVQACRSLLDGQRYVSVDYLGEDTTKASEAEATVNAYLSLLEQFKAVNEQYPSENSQRLEVSLKLSALGQFLPEGGHDLALANARRICTAAADAGVWVTVDAEDHTTTDSTLGIVRELRVDYPWLGTVLQAYLHRTEDDCREFAGAGSRIRLCKGAYAEPESVAYQAMSEVNASYLRCLTVLMEGQGYPMVASHDPRLITAATGLARKNGRGVDDFEFQMLYGIRTDEQQRLIDEGNRLRVYVPFGDEWYGYFMRRLAERPANLTFFLRSLISSK